MSVAEAFAQEQPSLLALPDNPFPTDECVTVSVGKTPYARYDWNDYSLPHTHARRSLTVLASLDTVRIVDGTEVIAEHARHFGKGEQIENPEHIQTLVDYKRAARHHRAQDRLAHSAPSSTELIRRGTERGYRPSQLSTELLSLLDSYGADELELAILESLAQGVPHPNAVRLALERRRDEHNRPPPLTVPLPEKARAANIVVRSGSLAAYDQINEDDAHDQTADNHHSPAGESP